MFEPELASGAVRLVLADYERPYANLWVMFSPARLTNARTRAFVRVVESALGAPFRSGMKKMSADRLYPLAAVAYHASRH